MLQIVVALNAVSPVVLKHRLVITFRHWAATILRLALGLAVAAMVYFAVIWGLVKAYPPGSLLGLLVYGAGFAAATLVAVIAGTLVSPARLSRIIIQSVCVLASLFPAGLYFYFGATGEWRAIYLLYLTGSVAGGYMVARLTTWAGDVPHFCGI
jgi:general stress protein CsbA